MLKWLWHKLCGKPWEVAPHMRCKNCIYFYDDYDPEMDAADNHFGYCEHPDNPTFVGYGVHWTYEKSGCPLWETRDNGDVVRTHPE